MDDIPNLIISVLGSVMFINICTKHFKSKKSLVSETFTPQDQLIS